MKQLIIWIALNLFLNRMSFCPHLFVRYGKLYWQRCKHNPWIMNRETFSKLNFLEANHSHNFINADHPLLFCSTAGRSLYEIVGVQKGATEEEIKKSYRRVFVIFSSLTPSNFRRVTSAAILLQIFLHWFSVWNSCRGLYHRALMFALHWSSQTLMRMYRRRLGEGAFISEFRNQEPQWIVNWGRGYLHMPNDCITFPCIWINFNPLSDFFEF